MHAEFCVQQVVQGSCILRKAVNYCERRYSRIFMIEKQEAPLKREAS